jgi:short-subunit dehydrogenase
MMQSFDGQVVWITGASSGIGEALVYAFVKKGATVIASSNDPTTLEIVKQNCGTSSTKVSCIAFDLSESGDISEIVKTQIESHNKIDILVNLGGVSQRAEIVDTPLWLDRKIMEINYF